MNDLLNTFLIQFTALFFVIDVIGIVPVFIALTDNCSSELKYKIIQKGVSVAFTVLAFFALLGMKVLDMFGISLAAFEIAGGILLFILAIELVLTKSDSSDSYESGEAPDVCAISVFPLAVPLLSGPGSIPMLILFMKQAGHDHLRQFLVMLALFLNMLICFVVLRFSEKISQALGKTGINVITRIFGILLAALACQFVINGITQAFHIKLG